MHQDSIKLNDEMPNAETIAAINDVRRMSEDKTIGKSYSSVDEMIEDLLTQKTGCQADKKRIHK